VWQHCQTSYGDSCDSSLYSDPHMSVPLSLCLILLHWEAYSRDCQHEQMRLLKLHSLKHEESHVRPGVPSMNSEMTRVNDWVVRMICIVCSSPPLSSYRMFGMFVGNWRKPNNLIHFRIRSFPLLLLLTRTATSKDQNAVLWYRHGPQNLCQYFALLIVHQICFGSFALCPCLSLYFFHDDISLVAAATYILGPSRGQKTEYRIYVRAVCCTYMHCFRCASITCQSHESVH